jgi:hypothetical protein
MSLFAIAYSGLWKREKRLKGSNNRTKKSSFRFTLVESNVREDFLISLWKKRECELFYRK